MQNTKNNVNDLEIVPNLSTCQYNIFETYLGCWDCLVAVNLQIDRKTLSIDAMSKQHPKTTTHS